MGRDIRLHVSTNVIIRTFALRDADALLAYYERNKEFHREWSPVPPPGFFTVRHQRERLQISLDLNDQGREYRFGIFVLQPEEELVGTVTFTAIERGVFQNGRLGYSVDVGYRNRGVMTAAIGAVLRFGFGDLGLHRIEANIMPRNNASRRVLEKCGFSKVGTSPRMLKINGVWEDHDMYMKLSEG